MVVQNRTLEDIMLAQPVRQWEVRRGRLREKPSMSTPHNLVAFDRQR